MPSLQSVVALAGLHPLATAASLIGLFVLYQACRALYNITLHPLRAYPGPLLNRLTPIPWAAAHTRGQLPRKLHEWHARYGPAVRVAPNHISYTDARAWRDIYGHRRAGGADEFAKAAAVIKPISALPVQITNAPRELHSRLRKALSNGFSDAAVRGQEAVIVKHVDRLMKGLREQSVDAAGARRPLDMVAWFTWTTFDLIGELVFAMSFGCLEKYEYHPWVHIMLAGVKDGAFMVALNYVGLGWINELLWKTVGARSEKTVMAYTDNMLQHRLSQEKDCADLFEGIVQKQKEWNMPHADLTANAWILVLGGSETTATLLSGAVYLLLTNPDKMARLQAEIRAAYSSDADITLTSVNQHTYMLAVLNETLRKYPPIASGLVRTVPAGGEVVAGRFVPGGTYVECSQWAMNHSADNWNEPFEFRPERFLDDNPTDVMEALQAFSVGPRNCIGRNLAYVEMRFILARLVFNFDLKLREDSSRWIERQRVYSLWSRVPLNVDIVPVERKTDSK